MWKSVALVAGLGGMFGAILAVAGRKLAVHTLALITASCMSIAIMGFAGIH